MRKNYDLSKAKRASEVPHLNELQNNTGGKTRITIMIDNDILESFRGKALDQGMGYQTLINQALRQSLSSLPFSEHAMGNLVQKAVRKELRKVLREELSKK